MELKKKLIKEITNSEITQDDANSTPAKTIFMELRRQYNRKNHKNYTQKEFADKLELQAGKVSELESGKRGTPSLSEALAYNKLTGASLEYLFGVDTESTKRLGLTSKAMNNLQQLKENPNNEMAFSALNHLLSSPDAAQFLNMLYQLWISPVFNIFDYDLSQLRPAEVAEHLLQEDSPLLSYALKCNVERQLLNYIDKHGMYDEKEYKKITASDDTDTATSDDMDDLLDS